jgi:hypothetical protein
MKDITPSEALTELRRYYASLDEMQAAISNEWRSKQYRCLRMAAVMSLLIHKRSDQQEHR